MFKFFKKIRQKVLTENKLSKYLIYAGGEIILVVIGILIAIQLNEWNQNRVEKKEYTVILENLENEFSRTRELLTMVSSNYESSIDASVILMQLFSVNAKGFSIQQIDTLLEQSLKQAPFYPPQPVLDEFLNSGQIRSLPNENLKRYLLDWETTIRWFHFDYDLFINFNHDQFIPFMNKHWSWKNIDIAAGSRFYEERSVLSVYQKDLFKDLEFENLIDGNLFHTNRLHIRIQKIDTLINNILIEIENSQRQ